MCVCMRTYNFPWFWKETGLDIANNIYQLRETLWCGRWLKHCFVLFCFKLETRVKDWKRRLQKGIQTKFSSQYFRPVVSYFQNLPSHRSGNCSVYWMIQFKYRIELILACEENCSNLISAIPMLNLQQHSISFLDLFTFRSIFCPLLWELIITVCITRFLFRRLSSQFGQLKAVVRDWRSRRTEKPDVCLLPLCCRYLWQLLYLFHGFSPCQTGYPWFHLPLSGSMACVSRLQEHCLLLLFLQSRAGSTFCFCWSLNCFTVFG